MKIVHISTQDTGGAGIAALRLHKGLLNAGVDSKFLCLHRTRYDVSGMYKYPKFRPSIRQRILERIGVKCLKWKHQLEFTKKYAANTVMFSFPETDYRLHNHTFVRQADVIVLHWFSYFLDIPSFFRKSKKPIVLVLHDQNPFLGYAHHEIDYKRNKDNAALMSVDKKLRFIKDKAYSRHGKLTIVAPSQWIKCLSEGSEQLKRFPHHHIPHGIDCDIFTPRDKVYLRDHFNLPKDKKLFLFAGDPKSFFKGFDLLQRALKPIQEAGEGCLVFTGEEKSALCGKEVFEVPHISDEKELSKLYSAVDSTIVPSRAEVFGNVIIESIASGTPVIGTSVGGIPEIIDSGRNGILADEVTPECIASAINLFINEGVSMNSQEMHDYILHKYSLEQQTNRYISVFNTLTGHGS
ncbi:MAG: glycosyltransferase [Candidatus Omnitrophica bacterium]|nr:glycosyltransferase [Candidatus Omnitrophota bacterium]